MATQTVTMRDAFTYSPGDGHRYSWTHPEAWITVERIQASPGGITLVPTGDRVTAPVTNTATALMAAVDAWRAAQ